MASMSKLPHNEDNLCSWQTKWCSVADKLEYIYIVQQYVH